MINLSQVQSMQYYELATNPATPTVVVELNGETSVFNIVISVDNTVWTTDTLGGEKFIQILPQAQQKAVNGPNTTTEVYPPQGVTITS